MTELLISLPDRLHRMICEVAGKQNIPVDEIIAASVTERLFRLIPDPYLEERAKRATGKGFSDVLSQVPDVPAEEHVSRPVATGPTYGGHEHSPLP